MLFKNALLCDYQGIRESDLRVKNGIITDSGTLNAHHNEDIFDVKGRLLTPAIIDLNVAPKSLSLNVKNLISLSKKALKGGVGSILLNPQTTPSCAENGSIELIKSLDSQSPIQLIPAINPLTKDGKLSDISTLHSSGGKAIFARSDTSSHLLIAIAKYAQMLDIPLICFCQDSDIADGVMNEGLLSASLGLPSIPAYSQTKEVAKIIEMLHALPIKLLFDTLVYPRSFEILKHFRADSIKAQFFTQTSIHHLLLDENLCENYNTAAKINPPLVCKDAKNTLLALLKNDAISTLTSLQCADFKSKKDQVFELASFGIDTLKIYFSLLYTYLHKSHNIPLPLLSKLVSYTPAQILHCNKGSLECGKIAEFIIVDTQSSFTLNDTFSPYNGCQLFAKVEALFSQNHLHFPHILLH